MKDEPTIPFKESEKVELVSETEGAELSAVQALDAPSNCSPAYSGSTAEPPGPLPPDESLTPWKKRRDPVARKRTKVILLVLAIAIVSPIVAVVSALYSIPNGPALVMLQTGLATGNRWMILEAYKKGWANGPEHVGVLINAANERSAVDRAAAVELYNDCVRINPNLGSCYMNRALNYTYLHKYDLAMADYNKAIQLNPNYALAFNNRAGLYRNLGQHERALSDYDRAVALVPNSAMVYYNRALTYGFLGKHAQELRDFLKSQELGYGEPALQTRINSARSHL